MLYKGDENDIESMLYKGDGIEINKKETSKYLKKAADKGDIESLKKQATMILEGDEIEQDKKEALGYFKVSSFLHKKQQIIPHILQIIYVK